MPQLWIVPAANDAAFLNVGRSLRNPLSTTVVSEAGLSGRIFAWGNATQENLVLHQMAAGDICIFYTQSDSGGPNGFHWAGIIHSTVRSAELAQKIWGDQGFQFVYFLRDAWPIKLDLADYAKVTGREPTHPIGLNRLGPDRTTEIERAFGSLEKWARSLASGSPPKQPTPGPNVSAADAITARISSSGFHFDPLTIRAFHASLQTKPFVILAGNSGTGKSRLARLYAECFGATTSNRGFCMIPVRPDWNDGSELIGYTDLENRFRPGRLIEPLLLAHALPERPFFVCLDEMNLARVEHYFSDFLSIVESRRLREGSIETDPLIRHEQLRTMDEGPLPTEIHAWIARARETKLDLGLPPNLFVIGTVNMDETTHPFSRKVLDRANTLELNSVDLKDGLNGVSPASEKSDLALRDVAPRFVRLADVVPAHRAEAEATIDGLEKLNAILAEAGLEVGYRVRDEATIFLIHGTEAGIPRSDAMECIALQKVLPRVHGSSPRLDRVLQRLLAHFIGADSPDPDADGFIEALMRIRREHPSRAARKVAGMWLLFREDNFTSFWIA